MVLHVKCFFPSRHHCSTKTARKGPGLANIFFQKETRQRKKGRRFEKDQRRPTERNTRRRNVSVVNLNSHDRFLDYNGLFSSPNYVIGFHYEWSKSQMLSTFRRFLRRSKAHDPADKRANSVKDDTLTSKESSFVKCLNIKRSSYGDTRGRLTWQLERLWRLHEELQLQLLELRIGTVPNNRRTKLQDAIAQARVINIASSNFADVPRGDWEPGWKSRRSVRNSPAQLCGNEAYAFNGHLNLRQVASAHRMRRLRAWSSGHQGSRLTVQSGLAPQELVKLPIQLSLQQLEGQKWSRTAVNSTVTGIQGPVEDSKVCKSQLQMASQASSRQQKEPADKVYRKTEPTTMQTLQPWRKVKKVDKFEKRYLLVCLITR
jgi:hypothetical protein